MKIIYLFFTLLFWSNVTLAQVGIGTTNPFSLLDIRSSNQATPLNTDGLLIPKVNAFPSVNPTANQQGMLVYLVNTSGVNPPGFYYWDFPTLSWVGFLSTVTNNTNPDTNNNNFEDFIFDTYAGAGTNDNQYSFTQANAGNNSYSEIEGVGLSPYIGGNDYAGRHVLGTGTSTTGRAGLGSFNFLNRLRLGGRGVVYEFRVRIENLSNATDNFVAYFGIMDIAMTSASIANFPPNNGVYFSYNHANNSGNWVGTTRSAAISTNVNSTTAVNAGEWYKIKAVINPTGTNVDFYINDLLVGNSALNIPLVDLKFVFGIQKSAGTTSRTASIDYMFWKMVR